VFLVALTGGIAAGKSTVAAALARHGAVVIDADAVAREVVEPGTPALAEIRSTFGDDVLDAEGALDRPKLGSVVFGHPEKLKLLNEIVHPAVKARVREALERIESETPDAVVVYDVPLLVEAQVDHPWDLVVVVLADTQSRLRRLVEERGLDEQHAIQRIQQQATDDERLAVADVVIHGDISLEETVRQAENVWQQIQLALKGRA